MDNKTCSGWDGDEELENILSILDFPMESLEADGLATDWDASKSDCLGPIPSDDVLMGLPPISHANRTVPVATPMDAPEPKIPPYGSVAYSGPYIPRANKYREVHEQGVLQSQSPVSVLESNGSSSGKILLAKTNTGKQARSKRVRPSDMTPWYLRSPFIVASRKGRRRLSQLPVTMKHSSSDHVQVPSAVKKCTHCESTKTPQWREGPLGPKTLCNACGVRYRSGRLFPEYRPAASPTFMPWLHSNSHKRVIEMRGKDKEQADGIH